MARGRPLLDAETKAKHRRETLVKYASKNTEALRTAARERMRSYVTHSAHYSALSYTNLTEEHHPSTTRPSSAAKYREKHRDKIRAADTSRRATSYLAANGTEALDKKVERPYMTKTQKRHEGRPPSVLLKRKHLAACLLPRKPRVPETPPTENQRRCRALRASGFEDDNGDDSDADLAPGICGCDLTECQRMHKNESAGRKDWKIFHLKYAHELAH
ncbi:hypothetical protein B0H13DRAFT_2366297 [Mycena leptocephala]|nr:hypothetical protein B0H13DRAFT_2366297 [Mycena leptocephala]